MADDAPHYRTVVIQMLFAEIGGFPGFHIRHPHHIFLPQPPKAS